MVRKMLKCFILSVVIAGVALFSLNQAMAAYDSCECKEIVRGDVTNNTLYNIEVLKAAEPVTCVDNLGISRDLFKYQYDYIDSSGNSQFYSVTPVCLNTMIVFTDSQTPNPPCTDNTLNELRPLGDTATNQTDFGLGLLHQRIGKHPSNVNSGPMTIYSDSSEAGLGMAYIKSGNDECVCGPIKMPGCEDVPQRSQSAVATFKQIEIVSSEHGTFTICLTVNPITQCETPVDCDTGEVLPTVPLADLQLQGGNFINLSVVGSECPTAAFESNGNTVYYCSGGYCLVCDSNGCGWVPQ